MKLETKTEARKEGIVTETWLKPHPNFRIQKILVPVDFSDASLKAVQYAMAMAGEFNAELILIHVVESYPLLPEMPAATLELQAGLEKEARARMNKLQKSIKGVNCSGLVRTGHSAHTIVAEAKTGAADLIIASTHGRTGLARAFLGSVTEQVVRLADCPVLVVREREREFLTVEPDNAPLNRIARPANG